MARVQYVGKGREGEGQKGILFVGPWIMVKSGDFDSVQQEAVSRGMMLEVSVAGRSSLLCEAHLRNAGEH